MSVTSNVAGIVPADVWRVAEDAADFLDGARDELAAVEDRMKDRLGAAPGRRILDVGCGTGHDIGELARLVVPGGRAVGVDTSVELVEQASSRASGVLEFRVADATDLPFDDGSFDATMCKRVVEHVADPAVAVAELVRVTAPGGTVVIADPDHGMWAPDMDDRETTRTLMSWWCDHIPHPWVARRLPGLLRDAGAVDVRVELAPLVLTTLDSADALTWIRKAAGTAARAGVLDEERAGRWERELLRRDAEGRFLMFGALTVVTGTVGEAQA